MKAQFILKTDDDQYVDLYEALVLAGRYSRSLQYARNRFLLCPVLRGLPVLVSGEGETNIIITALSSSSQRDPASKWFVSPEEIPPTTLVYPTDCTGWLYLTNPGTAAALVRAATAVKFFWIDDVWVTGFLARHLAIQHLDIIKYWTMQRGRLLLYKSIQNPDIYHEDFVSGPMDRDAGLSLALHRRARWCHLNRCYNNIYQQHKPHRITELLNLNMIKKLFPS